MRLLCDALRVKDDTQFQAVTYFDALLDSYTVQQNDLSLLALACIYVAAKKPESHLNVSECLLAAGSNYTPHQLRDMELRVLTTLDWRFSHPLTSADFTSPPRVRSWARAPPRLSLPPPFIAACHRAGCMQPPTRPSRGAAWWLHGAGWGVRSWARAPPRLSLPPPFIAACHRAGCMQPPTRPSRGAAWWLHGVGCGVRSWARAQPRLSLPPPFIAACHRAGCMQPPTRPLRGAA